MTVRDESAPAGNPREAAQQAIAQASGTLRVATRGKGFADITGDVGRWLGSIAAGEGLLTCFIRHTSASLLIQENADPDVLRDLSDALAGFAPERVAYRHDSEGPDDMPAHIRTVLTGVSLSIPVLGGVMRLGVWQAIYVAEHRSAPHTREVALHFIGSTR